MKISVICIYNKKKEFEEELLRSLNNQDINYEMIAIDNTKRIFSSAASALNYCTEKATGDVLIFSHQDIYLKTPFELRKLAEQITVHEIGDIVGTQGVKEKSKNYFSNLTVGYPMNSALAHGYQDDAIQVSSVDEGLFGMLKSTWENHHFDERLCDNWHLYCVEMCLWARKNGHGVYVYPAQIHHFSYGHISISYMKGIVKLADAYRSYFKLIWTTCYKVHTSWLYVRTLYMLWVINRIIHNRSLN